MDNKETEGKSISNLVLDAIRVKGLTIDKLSQMTGISERFLNSFLEERYEKMPPAPYLRGYLLKISDVLNLDGERLWRDYLKNHETMRRSGKKDILPPNRFETSKLNKKFILLLIVILSLVYFASQIPNMVGRPSIEIQSFEDNQVVSEPAFALRGEIKPTDELTINGEPVYPQGNGKFTKIINLQPGFNTVVFKVKRFLGKENIVTKQVYYESMKKQ